jgi:hypothetical protein
MHKNQVESMAKGAIATVSSSSDHGAVGLVRLIVVSFLSGHGAVAVAIAVAVSSFPDHG